MHLPRLHVTAVQIALDAKRRVSLADLKNSILALSAIWIGYFLIITFFIQSLDDINTPYLDMPLGDALVMQGVVAIFSCSLVALVRHERHT